MARLVNIGTGEIADRLSILALKIVAGQLSSKDTAHFRNEQTTLLQQLKAKNQFATWLGLGQQLAAVNAFLWQAEDEMREYRRNHPGTHALEWWVSVTTCAFRIQELNDQRAELVRLINETTGEHLGAEKL